MLDTLNSLLLVLSVVLGALPLLLTARLKRRLREPAPEAVDVESLGPVTVILPCKGLDPGFESNISALFAQDYPILELIFVVATVDDPAHRPLQDLARRHGASRPGLSVQVLVAGISPLRAQKLTNQLLGVQSASSASGIYVFMDSDIRPDRGFVRRLVAPLVESAVGATTGYRWYHPPVPTIGSMLRSTWNAGALPFLVDPKRVFAWGGAMAIRRETFDAGKIADVWHRAVSDDLTLTVAIRRLGLKLRFVTTCIAVSYEASTLAQTLEFTNRQSLISRVYFSPLWWGTAVGHSLANFLILWGMGCLIAWIDGGRPQLLIGAGCVLLLAAQLANAAWLFDSARTMLPTTLRPALSALRWHYLLAAPLASLMTLVNTIHSVTSRRINWRGVHYELRSPTDTVVIAD